MKCEEYLEMINSVGWKCPSKRLLEKSLKNSMTVKYIQDGNIVNVKIIQNVRIDDKYLEENGYL